MPFDLMQMLGGAPQLPQPVQPQVMPVPAPVPTPVPQQPQLPTNDVQPNLSQQWSQALQNQNVRSALLTAGLSMLGGGWGSHGQRIAKGLGAGFENYSKNEQQDEAQAIAAQSKASARSERAADRSSRERIADKNNQTRLSAAQIRKGGGAKTLDQWKQWNAIYTKEKARIGGTGLVDGEELEAAAAKAADRTLAMGQERFGNGAGLPADVGARANPAGGTAGSENPGKANKANAANGPITEGTEIKLKDGTIQVLKNGQWVNK